MQSDESPEPVYLIEVRGVYDGWSIAVQPDGTHLNRWEDAEGHPWPGYERQWRATRDAIAAIHARCATTAESADADR